MAKALQSLAQSRNEKTIKRSFIRSLFPLPFSLLLAFSILSAHAEETLFKQKNDVNVTIAYTNAVVTRPDGEYGNIVFTFSDPTAAGSLTLPSYATAWILSVGGGGAGATCSSNATGSGGGGGAGGFVEQKGELLNGGTYTITVGAGGAAGTDTVQSVGDDGKPSSISLNDAAITKFTAAGGGGGGVASDGRPGASGGGGSYDAATKAGKAGGAGSQGSAGGAGGYTKYAGGGGGAGAVGSPAESAASGKGGDGLSSKITLSVTAPDADAVFYAGGGGGSVFTGSKSGLGGAGGGGRGGYGKNGVTPPENGTDGLGGGGGGGTHAKAGAAGGSGVVIIRISEALDGPPKKPVKPEGLYYNGENQEGVPPSLAYELTGVSCATNAGKYSCKATLKKGFVWSDDGSTDPVSVDWEIKPQELTPPQGISVEYNGEMKFAIPEPDPGLAFTDLDSDGCTNAIDAADYHYTVKPKDDNYMWKDATEGEERVEKTIDWSITPKPVDRPIVPTLTFNGENQVAIIDPNPVFVFKELGVGNNCTNAVHGGNYCYKVGLESTNYMWKDAEEGKEHDVLTIDWSIDPKPITPPTVYTDLVYNDKYQEAFDTDTIDEDICKFTPESTYSAKEADQYTFTLVLQNEQGDDYCWSDGTAGNAKTFPWSIARAPNEVTEFSIFGWKVGTPPRTPTFHSLWGEETVTFRWSDREEAPVEEWVDFTTNPPTEPGAYWLWAYVAETKNWVVAQAKQSFSLWDDPELIFTDFVEIRVENASGNDYVDYPLELVFSENHPAGFTYDRAGENGKSLLFVDEDGSNQLPYDINDWVTDGESKLTVYLDELPKVGTTIRLYWHVQEGAEPPAPALIPEHPATKSPLVKSSFGEVHRDGLKVDSWSVEPSLSPTEWDYVEGGEQPLTVTGELASGAAVTKVFFNIYTPNETNDLSEAGKATNGVYLAVFYNNSRDDYEPIAATVQFVVVGHTPSMDITGNKGDSGRVLLMNNDGGDGARKPIDYQGWYDADASGAKKSTTSTFWQFLGTDDFVTDSAYNLKTGTNCVLWTANYGRRLWQLVNCRHGNTYEKGETKATPTMNDTQNYLPWSSTSYRIIEHRATQRAARACEVGQVVMRNVEGAAVYSTFFTDGVGTIYFDAVNGWNTPEVEGAPAYEIVVEVSTNALDDATLIPDSDWTAVKMYPVHVKGSALTAEAATERFNLAVTGGGAKDEFYRIYVPVNYRMSDGEGLRFRIRRVSINTKFSKDPDGKALILIDNVLVSYPPMGAKLVTTGAYDRARTGTETLGWEGATLTPYPSTGAKNVIARAVPVYFTGAGDDSADPTRFIMSAKMKYRWRYLDQLNAATTPWSEVNLNPADGYKAMDPLVLPEQAGDIEYWFEARVQAPFFSYKDYSGQNLEEPFLEVMKDEGHSEEMATTSGAYELAEGERLPSQGKDWFFRLREGASDYRSMHVVAEQKGPKDTWLPFGVATLELVGDSSWRGYLKTPDPIEDGLRIRLEGYSPRGEAVTNFWCTATDAVELPKSYKVEPCAADGGRMVPCESRTGHLSFQFDERTETLTISRADFQDFNHWSMAVTNLFVGSSVEKNYAASNVGETNVDWTAWTASVATNADWREDFKVTSGERADQVYPKNKPFANALSKHGWTVENALWTYGKWTHETWSDDKSHITTFGDDSAVQLEGRGKGRLAFINQTSVPSGLDSIALTLRLAQFTDFDSFNFWNKTDVTIDWIQQRYELVYASQMQNYTFVTYGSLSDAGGNDYSGDGTISLAGYFTTDGGCYEARFSRGSKDTNLRIRLLRWKSDGLKMDFEDLGFKEFELSDSAAVDVLFGNAMSSGALFLSLGNEASGTLVQAGVMKDQAILSQLPNVTMDQKDFWCVSYLDASKARLTHGAFGVQSANCHAYLRQPSYWTLPVAADTATPPVANTIVASEREKLLFRGTYKYDFGESVKTFDEYFHYWMERPGRLKQIRLTGSPAFVGFESNVAITNLLETQTATHGKSDWSPLSVTNVVTSFRDVTVTNVVHDRKTCDVRFLVLGQPNDVRTDVVINDVELTQWCGQETPGLEGSQSYARCNEFVYTCGWLEKRVPAEAGKPLQLALQPARAKDETAPLSLRSPLLKGVGLIHFSWKDADPKCKLHLQLCEDPNYYTLQSMLVNVTREKPDGQHWTTLKTWNFSNPTTPREGSDTVYINHRAPTAGVLRLVIDGQVVAEALSSDASKTNPFYGGIRITDAYVWDLPAYDSRCWSAWNMRAEGWANGKPTSFAYLADYDKGYSGLLNNTLSASTLCDARPEHFKQNPPYVQSPTFETNCIGEVIFRARLYNVPKRGNPAVVTCYGATQLDAESLEPTNWVEVAGGSVEINATTYRTYSIKFKASDSFYALRFAVKGVSGVIGEPGQDPVYDPPARVALDSICVLEQAQPAVRFRKLHALPFRDSGYMRTTALLPEDLISSPDQQPLLGEAFGFQAELELEVNDPGDIRTDDPRHPLSVELHVYPYKEPWGYENWKDLPEAKHVTLVAADGTNLVFRSTMARPDSIVKPVFKKDVGEYGLVQYHMTARYYDKAGEQLKHELSSRDWQVPPWYNGFTDPNRTAERFSAYTLLEEVPPGRVWINEVNTVEASKATSQAWQALELAVPMNVDITGWKVYAYSLESALKGRCEGNDPLVTIGRGNCKTASKSTGDYLSRYAFLTVGSPAAKSVETDGRWNSINDIAIKDGKLDWELPYGFELRRPSGVIEHRVVVEGNASEWAGSWFYYQYTGTNLVRELNALTTRQGTGGGWIFAGQDPVEQDFFGLSVIKNHGAEPEDWAVRPLTFGLINDMQVIPPDWYVPPQGDYVWVYLSCLAPQIRMLVNGETRTGDVLTLNMGGSTNVSYEVDNFYEISDFTLTSEHARYVLSAPTRRQGKTYYDLLVYDVSNRVDVSASADVSADLKARGVTPDNPYTPAIMRWLTAGCTRDRDGRLVPFAGDEVHDFIYRYPSPTADGTETTNLSAKVAYWLDVDITQEGWELQGGMGDSRGGALGPVSGAMKRQRPGEALIHTNRFGTMWMMLTNTVTGVAHQPWRLQGLANERSDDVNTYQQSGWTSVTFKVTGKLLKSIETGDIITRPLRYLVFNPQSFREADDPVAPFSAKVEIVDPFSKQSPASDWGWGPFWQCPVGVGWGLGDELTPAGVSTMRFEDLLENYGPVIP